MRPWHVPTPSTPRCRRCRPPYVALNLSAYAPPRCACRQAPAILRLVFHDAGTWDPDTRTGGPNGSIRLELDRPENAGLKRAVASLDAARKALAGTPAEGLSWADLIPLAGAYAGAAERAVRATRVTRAACAARHGRRAGVFVWGGWAAREPRPTQAGHGGVLCRLAPPSSPIHDA